ncbi:hypothetical protein SAMN03159444_05370 [Pseudomonas sp. NFACC02]|nr:hypothetical protein SAMN03159444_05370 [Pseudomonas sp. NFACC02]
MDNLTMLNKSGKFTLATLACCISLSANSQTVSQTQAHSFGVRENISEGGREAQDYVSYDRGMNTWRGYYYQGGYLFTNLLSGSAESEVTNQDVRSFGHICKQRLINSVAG